MTPPDDRLRALDQVEPADSWTDITRRADGPADLALAPATARSKFHRPALIAAAVLVVATIAGVAALAARPDDGARPVASNGGHTTTPAGVVAPATAGAAESFWGRRWTVVERFDADDAALAVVKTIQGSTPVFDTRTEGTVFFTGCNGAGARVRLSDARLIQQEELPGRDMGCMPPDLMAQDDWFAALLAEDPTVAFDGRRLTLTTPSGKRVELMDIEGRSGDTATTTSMPPWATPMITAPDSGGSSSQVLPPGPTPGLVTPSGSNPLEPAPTTTVPGIEQGDGQFLGHSWRVNQMVDGGSDPGFSGAIVDTSRPGQVTVPGCNGAGGPMRLVGDRLRVDGASVRTQMACGPSDGLGSMQQDDWFDAFLGAEPTVSVSGRTATLTTSTATVSLRLP